MRIKAGSASGCDLLPGSPPAREPGPDTGLWVRDALSTLDDADREILMLREYEQLSYVEIAQALGASVPQVKTWLHRARRQLAGMLEGYVKGKQR